MELKKNDIAIEISDSYTSLEVEATAEGFGFTIDYTRGYIDISDSHAKEVADFIYNKLGLELP